MSESERIAALEQRVGALVEALLGCFGPDGADSYGDMATRLAALRAPGVGAMSEPPMSLVQAGLGQAIHDALARAGCTEVPLLPRALPSYIERALATARRERDEAVGVLAEVSARMMDDESLCWCASARLPGEDHQRACTRARALVAGHGVEHDCGASVEPGCDKTWRERLEWMTANRDGFHEARDRAESDLAARDAEIAGLKAKLAGAEHAIADLTTTFGTVESERDTLRARVAELEARDREGRALLRRWLAPWGSASHSEHLEDIERSTTAYLSGATPPDPARGLIERAVKVLKAYVPMSEADLLADLRAYLGGG